MLKQVYKLSAVSLRASLHALNAWHFEIDMHSAACLPKTIETAIRYLLLISM